MEPMTLGSPVSNPASPPHFGSSSFYHNPAGMMGTPGHQGPAHAHNGFLPGYLMGDYAQQVTVLDFYEFFGPEPELSK